MRIREKNLYVTKDVAGNPWAPTLVQPNMSVNIIAVVGSLRRGSFNSALLDAYLEHTLEGVDVRKFDLSQVPFYDFDVEAAGYPDAVGALRAEVADADGLLVVSPEYNAGPPAVTKNAIDWLSRGPQSPLAGKPVALAGVGGRAGTGRAQAQLRENLNATRSFIFPPALAVTRSDDMFDDSPRLVDPAVRERVIKHLAGFGAWIRRLGQPAPSAGSTTANTGETTVGHRFSSSPV